MDKAKERKEKKDRDRKGSEEGKGKESLELKLYNMCNVYLLLASFGVLHVEDKWVFVYYVCVC